MNKHQFERLIQSARDANLVDYFLQSGYKTQRHGDEIYVAEFPSLCVNKSTNQYYYHYENIGGSNAVDCLVNVCGHDFKQAVYELSGHDISNNQSKSVPQKYRPQFTSPPNSAPIKTHEKQLQMPPSAENMRRVFAYFIKERKIPAAIVEEFAHLKLLYQSSEKIKTIVDGVTQISNPQNAVFVHRDKNGDAIGGEVQGVNSFRRFKGIVAGTGDSVFMFTPNPSKDNKPKTAYLFESGIDLMSFYALCKREKLQGVTLVSMAGLKPSVPKLLQSQNVNVLSFVDNDDMGRKFESDNGFKRGSDVLEKSNAKDWNQLLTMSIDNPDLVKDFTPETTNIEPKKNIFARKKT